MFEEDRMLVREAARYWWLFLVSGVVWLVVAWLILRVNATFAGHRGHPARACCFSSRPGSTRWGSPASCTEAGSPAHT